MAKTAKPQTDYKRYLASREWGLLKEQVRKRSCGDCEHCWNAEYRDTHHLTYERVGHERLEDLMAVCRPCHEWLSGKSSINPLAEWWVITPRLELKTWPKVKPYHLRIPIKVAPQFDTEGVHVEWCLDGCIWCGYGDVDWAAWLVGMELKKGQADAKTG